MKPGGTCPHPETAFAIFEQHVDGPAVVPWWSLRQSVHSSITLDAAVGPETVQRAAPRSNPQRSLAVFQQNGRPLLPLANARPAQVNELKLLLSIAGRFHLVEPRSSRAPDRPLLIFQQRVERGRLQTVGRVVNDEHRHSGIADCGLMIEE